MAYGENPACLKCAHWRPWIDAMACDAFPAGIPEEILLGAPHNKPFSGDRGIVFKEQTGARVSPQDRDAQVAEYEKAQEKQWTP